MPDPRPLSRSQSRWQSIVSILLLVGLFFAYAGDTPPMVNEAHYLVKAKNFWQPDWCKNDLFASSSKAHTTFYVLFGWPTKFVSLATTAWIGRFAGWTIIAIGLNRLTRALIDLPLAPIAVACLWISGIEYGNLAGEWVIGGIEAKVPAYGFVLLAMSYMLERRWNRVWIWLGVASAFHVLTGGWSVVAAMIAWFFSERPRLDAYPLVTPGLFLGGAIAMAGLIPALALTIGVGSEDSAAAARIYTYFRLRHHLLPADFDRSWYVRHCILLALTFVALHYTKEGRQSEVWSLLNTFSFGAIGIACVGLLVGLLPSVMPELAAKLLRYYWFRLSDAIVPLWFAMLVLRWFELPTLAKERSLSVWMMYPATWFILLSVMLVGVSTWDRLRVPVPPSASNQLLGWDPHADSEEQKAVYRDWVAVCRWVKGTTSDDAVLLTPRHQQTFKWYAERAEVVNWKDVPQDAASLKLWYKRFGEVYPSRLGTIRVTISYPALIELRTKYDADYVIVDRRVVGPQLALLRIYPEHDNENEHFAVYELPQSIP